MGFSANDGKAIYLRVTFTPAANAPQDIKENGVKSELYFGTTTEMKYDGKDIFKFSNTGNGTLDNIFTWTKVTEGENVSFVYELDQAALEGMISLGHTFVLDTKAEHDAFRTALTGNIVARVTDGTVNQ